MKQLGLNEEWNITLAWVNFMAYNCLTSLLSADSLLYALITVVAMDLKLDLMTIQQKPGYKDDLKRLIKQNNELLKIGDTL